MQKLIKNCPSCNKELSYTSIKTLRDSIKKNRCCMECRWKIHKNGMSGKHHSKESISIMSEMKIGKYSGEYNPNFGKTKENSIWWNKKHTKETREKMSKSAIKNINGHSIGVKGKYKGIFFRSCLELCYIIYLVKYKINFITEPRLGITYLEDGINKNYIPDFLIEDKYLVEIKPKEFQNKPKILLKSNSAINYCNKNNLKYKIIQPKITYKVMAKEYLAGNIVLSTDEDKDKFLRKFKSKNKKLLEK